MTTHAPDAYRLPNGTIVRLGFGDRWETTDGYPLPEPPDLDGATPLWLSEAAPPDTLAAAWDEGASEGLRTPRHLAHWLTNPYRAALAAASPVAADTETADVLRCGGGCGLAYTDPAWVDVLIPTEVWVQISPRGDESGVMCMTCTARALVAKGIDGVPMAVTSGPWAFFFLNGTTHVRSPLPLAPAVSADTAPKDPS